VYVVEERRGFSHTRMLYFLSRPPVQGKQLSAVTLCTSEAHNATTTHEVGVGAV
jgi:hypothetical protein